MQPFPFSLGVFHLCVPLSVRRYSSNECYYHNSCGGVVFSPFSLTRKSLFHFHSLSLKMAPMCRWLVVIGCNFLNKNKDFHYTSKGSKTNNNFQRWMEECFENDYAHVFEKIESLFFTSRVNECSKYRPSTTKQY